jgi:O-antigen ligase
VLAVATRGRRRSRRWRPERPPRRLRPQAKSTTSGRGTLVRRGSHIAVHHPVAGVGLGGFKHAYAELAGLKGKEPNAAASHTTPVTVAAEGGIVGFALYVWLLVAALGLAFRRFARDLPGLAALTFGLVIAAVAVHSLFYNAFFEDPTVWAAIGLAPGCRAERTRPRSRRRSTGR